MSKLTFLEEGSGSIPTPPTTGQHTLFVDTDDIWKSKDDAGAVSPIGTVGSPEVTVSSARKGSPGTITVGQVVYQSGWDAGNGIIEVELAEADVSASMPALGICTTQIEDSVTGIVTTFGLAENINTTGEAVGDPVYVSATAGAWTTTRPVAASDAVQKIGTISTVGASGRIFMVGAGRANDIPNLETEHMWKGVANVGTPFEIGDLTEKVTPVATDYLLMTDSAASNVLKKVDATSLGGAGSNHNMLSATHLDSTTAAVTRGSLIYGNATPAWDELVVGTGVLKADGTDITGWATVDTTDITNGAVDNTKLADMAAWTIQLNNSAGSADPAAVKISALTEEVSPAALDWVMVELASGELRKSDIGNLPSGGGNHNMLSATHLDAVTSTPVRGDLMVANATPAWDKLAVGGANTVLHGGTDPSYSAVVTNDISDDQVTYAKIQNVVADDVFLGNIAGAGGIVAELTGTQATVLLDLFTDVLQGVAPASGGGTVNYLRADGTWATPPGTFTGNTLDQAYDEGGAGAGRTINLVTTGSAPVNLVGTSATGDSALVVASTATGVTNNTKTLAEFTTNRTQNTSVSRTDNFDNASIKRTSVMNDGLGSFTVSGGLLKLETVSTQTAGTLTDNTILIEGVLDVDSANKIFCDFRETGDSAAKVAIESNGGGGNDGMIRLGDGAGLSGEIRYGGSGTITVASVLNATSGFRIGSAAATGNYIRGNGSNFVSSGLLGADLDAGGVDNTKLVDMAAWTIQLRNAGTSGDPAAVKISALTDEPSPTSGDFGIMELASGELRRFDFANLPAGSETNNLAVDGIAGIADDQLAVGTGAGTAAYQTLSNGAVAYSTTGGTFSQANFADLGTTTHTHEDAANGGTLNSAALPTAYTSDTASEISGTTLKGTPVSGDFILIEDSAAGNVKKHITVGSLPAGSEVNDLATDGIAGIADNQLAVGTGAGTAGYQTLPTSQALSFNGTSFTQASASELSDGVPNTRTLDINGDANEIVVDLAGPLDLSANRAWSIGIADSPTIPGEYMTVPLKADPDPTGSNGRLFYNTTDNVLRYAESTTWRDIVYAGGAFHEGFSDKDPDQHIDHTTVSMTVAGTANEISSSAGAQDISTSRTWTLGIADAPTIPGDYMTVPLKADPDPTGSNGRLFYNTTDNALRYAVSTAWKDVANLQDAQTFSGDITHTGDLVLPLGVTTATNGEVTIDATADQFVYRSSGSEHVIQAKWSKAQGWKDPATGDTMILFYALGGAVTITDIVTNQIGGTSVAWEVRFGTDPTAAGTLNESGTTSASTSMTVDSAIATPGVTASNACWVELDTVTGAVEEFFIEVHCTWDRQ